MLVYGDSSRLSDPVLPIHEAIAKHRLREVEPMLEKYRLYDHRDLKDLHLRAGKHLHASQLILRVRKLNPLIFVEQQINYPDQWGFYYPVEGRQIYLSGFDKGWLREFSAILVDEQDIPAGDELRGWRTVLLKLLTRGALRWEQVHKEFGDVTGVNATRWLIYTRPYRQGFAREITAKNLDF